MDLPIPLKHSIPYLSTLGTFHSNWSSIDLFTDFAIYQFLRVTPQQAHLITSGMMFGRKAKLLDDLIKHSSDKRKGKLLEAFNKIRASKREMLTHSYVASDALSVTFMERNISGPFSAKLHTFSGDEFKEHVKKMTDAANEFFEALEVSQVEINAFVNAALSLNRKS